MKSKKLINVISAATLGLCLTGSATAGPGDCANDLTAVTDAINAATFTGPGPDQTKLGNKVVQATAKVNLNKCDDALNKLDDIDMKVMDLSDDVGKQKLSPEDATTIMNATSAAVQCIGMITTCK